MNKKMLKEKKNNEKNVFNDHKYNTTLKVIQT